VDHVILLLIRLLIPFTASLVLAKVCFEEKYIPLKVPSNSGAPSNVAACLYEFTYGDCVSISGFYRYPTFPDYSRVYPFCMYFAAASNTGTVSYCNVTLPNGQYSPPNDPFIHRFRFCGCNQDYRTFRAGVVIGQSPGQPQPYSYFTLFNVTAEQRFYC